MQGTSLAVVGFHIHRVQPVEDGFIFGIYGTVRMNFKASTSAIWQRISHSPYIELQSVLFPAPPKPLVSQQDRLHA